MDYENVKPISRTTIIKEAPMAIAVALYIVVFISNFG